MAVDDDWEGVAGLDRLDEVVSDARREQAGHVLDADGIAVHFHEFVRQGGELGRRMHARHVVRSGRV